MQEIIYFVHMNSKNKTEQMFYFYCIDNYTVLY